MTSMASKRKEQMEETNTVDEAAGGAGAEGSEPSPTFCPVTVSEWDLEDLVKQGVLPLRDRNGDIEGGE